MNILILGAGTFGTAIGNELSVNRANSVLLYSSNQDKIHEINTEHTNKSYFPNKHLSHTLRATSSKEDVKKADVILIALPSSTIKDNLIELKGSFKEGVLIINLSKGLLSKDIITDMIKEVLGINNVVTLKGPSFASEIMERADTLLTLGYTEEYQFELVNKIIKDTSLHIDYTTDIRGVELLSVLKNIYALVVGIVDAKYNSPNTRFMILTKSFSEIRILLRMLGGKEDTLFLACGFGDLCLTSLNDLSRNRTLGLLIGKGFFNSDYKSNTVVLEGLNAINTIYDLSNEELKKDLPLLTKIYSFFKNKENIISIEFDKLVDAKRLVK